MVLLASSSTTLAEPAPVTVRVEGLAETKLLPTQVAPSGPSVVKDGNPAHVCVGTSAIGALERATAGNWLGTWFSGLGYSVESIEGEAHVFESGAPANYFWSFWLNEKESEKGACEAEVKAGDRVLFLPSCFGSACPQPTPLPLGVEAVSNANVGEPVSVTVKKFSASGVASEVAGAAVVGGGAGASTDAHGHATLTFLHPGETIVRATASEAIRAETSICVHAGNDGTCGTQKPGTGPSAAAGAPAPLAAARPYIGPYAVVAKATGVLDGHVYTRRSAPRVLSGIVIAHTGVSSVAIKLRRRHRGRCTTYDGRSERFVATRCGAGNFFKVSSTSSFSYLLPFALRSGEYVFDIEATDVVGNRTTLARGTSRIRFYVH
jgi:hypothetical protein